MEYKGELARRGRGANVIGLITDVKWTLVYRLLAWHGTMLSDFNL